MIWAVIFAYFILGTIAFIKLNRESEETLDPLESRWMNSYVFIVTYIISVFFWPALLLMKFLIMRWPNVFNKDEAPEVRDAILLFTPEQLVDDWQKADGSAQALNEVLESVQRNDEKSVGLDKKIIELENEFRKDYQRFRHTLQYQNDEFFEKIPDKFKRANESWPEIDVSVTFVVDGSFGSLTVSSSTIDKIFPLKSGWDISFLEPIQNRKFESSPWRLGISAKFRRKEKKISDDKLRVSIRQAIEDVLLDPLNVRGNAKKPMSGDKSGIWRIRIGAWRLIYTANPESKQVFLLDIDHRSKIY